MRPEASSVQPETVDGEALKQGNMKAIEVRSLERDFELENLRDSVL